MPKLWGGRGQLPSAASWDTKFNSEFSLLKWYVGVRVMIPQLLGKIKQDCNLAARLGSLLLPTIG